MFDPVDPRQSFPALEKAILQYWREEDMFRRSVHHRAGCERFSFYDGPPFATGLPHYGHLLAGTIKDVIPRYQTMRGKQVQRRFGWDCHGLPIENLIEKEHGIKSKKEIEEKGVKWFNDLCRGSVQRYTSEWRATVERMGRWVDMDWDYRTLDPQYMESMWWVFSALYAKGLIFEGHKPMHICPRCVTPLSNFEVGDGYKDVTDVTATAMFEITEKSSKGNVLRGKGAEAEGKTFFLAWTTTPWTLPGNLFLAVHPDTVYATVECEGAVYIVAKELVETVFADKEYSVQGKGKKGSSLAGLRYKPLFPYFTEQYGNEAFRVVPGDFVTTTDGTGIVHIAPGFGEDDYNVGKREKVPLLQHVTMDGLFTEAVTDFSGIHVKPIDDPSKTDRKIIEWLEKHGLLFKKESYRHSYPHCWRCDSPLLNYATSAWFVGVEQIKDDLLTNAKEIDWMPAHLKEGRFGKWLANAKDWTISRNRYWGTPLPIWKCGDQYEVLAGRDDLMMKSRLRFAKITLCRHAESEGNISGIYQGVPPATDLTKRGREQAAQAGMWMKDQNVDIIYCSPLARTQQTAQAIADATGARIVVDERLRELHFGEYEGKEIDQSDLAILRARRAKKLEAGTPESVYHLAGMERWESVGERTGAFLREIIARHRSEHVVVVSHADPIMTMRQFFTNEDPMKLSHQPYPDYATPEHYFWDFDREAPMDLHKDTVDDIVWSSGMREGSVDITLARHGETDYNKEKRAQGRGKDIHLNDTGRAQAAELGETLKKEKKQFDVIVSSTMARAMETADIAAAALGMEVSERIDLLDERDCGDWAGRLREDIYAEFPAAYPEMTKLALHHATPENGESLSQFFNRCTQAAEYLLKHYAGKRVLVVAHGGVAQAIRAILENATYRDGALWEPENGQFIDLTISPFFRRIPEVLDCWFESGSMPYAQENYPYRMHSFDMADPDASAWSGDSVAERSKRYPEPVGFPADFIAEGVDQTRLWFYTLHVLGTILMHRAPYRNVVVNGIVLAEDGKKMSKKLRNYPDPIEVVEQYGADALRFALMSSPAVKAEDLRFSDKVVAETVRGVLLPLWNAYGFFVTYANAAQWEPVASRAHSDHPLDRWIRAEAQDLVNRMTLQLDRYDLSATCAELHDTIDALTNWYIRLSRRRFAGKTEYGDATGDSERNDALATLHSVLTTITQLLAPFCPFVAESIYLNLVPDAHGSVHLTDWPNSRKLTKEESALIEKTRLLRTIVSLGLTVRSEAKIRQRCPLARATVAMPPSLHAKNIIAADDIRLLEQELNVKSIELTDDPGSLGERILQIDARKVGPRVGGKVQQLIAAGKKGEFEQKDDGTFLVMDETIGPDEAQIIYRGREGENVAAAQGIVVSVDTRITPELEREGTMRELIRSIQVLRKDAGLQFTDRIALQIDGFAMTEAEAALVETETRSTLGACDAEPKTADIDGTAVTMRFTKL